MQSISLVAGVLVLLLGGEAFQHPLAGTVVSAQSDDTIACIAYSILPFYVVANTTAFFRVSLRNCGTQNFTASPLMRFTYSNSTVIQETVYDSFTLGVGESADVDSLFPPGYPDGNYNVTAIANYSNELGGKSVSISAVFYITSTGIVTIEKRTETHVTKTVAAATSSGGGGGRAAAKPSNASNITALSPVLASLNVTAETFLNATKGVTFPLNVTLTNTGGEDIENISIYPVLPFAGNATGAEIDLISPNQTVPRTIGIVPAEEAMEQLYIVPLNIYTSGELFQEKIFLVNVVEPENPVAKIETIEYLFEMPAFKGEQLRTAFLVKNRGDIPVRYIHGSVENFEGCIAAPSFSGIESLEPGKAGEMAFTAEALAVEKACNATLVVSGEGASDIKPVRIVVKERPGLFEALADSFSDFYSWFVDQLVQSLAHVSKLVSKVYGK